ncbi:MAG: peptide chain release factor N(5)-glutamine methyltransferase [Pseudomonadota bacterium]
MKKATTGLFCSNSYPVDVDDGVDVDDYVGVDDYEARLLLRFVLDVSGGHLITHPNQTLTVDQLSRYRSLIERRLDHEPLAYLTGRRGFWSRDLKITSCVLDPRPDTETLVQACLDHLDDAPRMVLDAGTGSGAIAGALIDERPTWQIFASDLSGDALKVARENLNASQVPLIRTDWTVAFASHSLDVIVSNPPYLANNDPHLGTLRHEPRMALVADQQGLGAFVQIINDARRVLRPLGWLIFEHGHTQRDAVGQLLRDAHFQVIHCIDDLAGNPRVIVARCGSQI